MGARYGVGYRDRSQYPIPYQQRLGASCARRWARRVVRNRILGRIRICPDTGCWIWQGAKNGAGYGHLGHRGKTLLAHRVSYEAFIGPIPTGALLRHNCDNRACCCPQHLAPGTYAQNTIDQYVRGRRSIQRTFGGRKWIGALEAIKSSVISGLRLLAPKKDGSLSKPANPPVPPAGRGDRPIACKKPN